jgi:hypothetical protein
MPTIFCSIKLAKLIGVKTRLPSLSIDNWNGHLFALQGRKCLVFVHKETFYSFVIFDVLKKELSDFKRIFTDNFLKQLANDHLLSDSLEDLIIKDFQSFELSTTDGDKSTIGYLNDCITRLTWERDGRSPTIEKTKIYVENYYNKNLLISRKAITPNELMAERLKNYQ